MSEHRVAIVTALEALGDGDQELAVAILLGALEHGPIVDPKASTPCPRRGCSFRGWAGEAERHLIVSHAPAPRSGKRRTVRTSAGRR